MDSPRNIVVSGSLDTTIRVWDISPGRGECVCVLIGHTSLTSGMQIVGNMLISCNADSSIRVFFSIDYFGTTLISWKTTISRVLRFGIFVTGHVHTDCMGRMDINQQSHLFKLCVMG